MVVWLGALLAAMLLSLHGTTAAAATYTWGPQSGDWSIASNWGGTAPSSSDTAYLNNGGTATVSLAGATASTVLLGDAGGSATLQVVSGGLTTGGSECVGFSGTGSVTQSGGMNSLSMYYVGQYLYYGSLYIGANAGSGGSYALSGSGLLSAADSEIVGLSGTGSFTQSGGTNSFSTNSFYGSLVLGGTAGSCGSYNLSGSGLILPPPYTGRERIGFYGTGSFTQSGGTNSPDIVGVGSNPGSNGSYILSGSGLLTVLDGEVVGAFGTGSFTQSGGTNSLQSSDFELAGGTGVSGSYGSYNLSGSGLLSDAAEEIIGGSGSGSFTQSGGTNSVSGIDSYPGFSASGALTLAQSASSVGTYNLNGGLLTCGSLSKGLGSAAFNFGGGTLGAVFPWSSSLDMTLTGSGGNATVDTTGGSIALSGNLAGPGGLQKIGNGELVLGGSNSYSGGTTVLSGELMVANNFSLANGSNLTVGADATSTFNVAEIGTPIASLAVAPVPEPATLALFAAAFCGAAVYQRLRSPYRRHTTRKRVPRACYIRGSTPSRLRTKKSARRRRP